MECSEAVLHCTGQEICDFMLLVQAKPLDTQCLMVTDTEKGVGPMVAAPHFRLQPRGQRANDFPTYKVYIQERSGHKGPEQSNGSQK